MNYKNLITIALCSILLAGCAKKKKIYPVDGFSVSGRVTYDKNTPAVWAGRVTSRSEVASVPCAFVEVIDTSDGNKVITIGITDDDGVFKIGLPDDLQNSPLAVKVYTACGLDDFQMSVNDQSTPSKTYFAQSEIFIGKKNDMELHIEDGLFAGTLAGAFNIYAQTIRGYKFVVNSGEETGSFPSLVVNWESGEEGAGCTCFFNRFSFQATINLRKDENDDSVILHEFGHYLHSAFSNTSNPGGPHIISCDQDDDPRLTWSEGWATGFSCIVRRNENYIDTKTSVGSFFVPHEYPCNEGQGSASETIIAAMYLDLYDGTENDMSSRDGDTISITFKQIWDAMKNVRSGSGLVVYDYFISLTNSGAVTKQQWETNFAGLGLDEAAMFLAR